MPLFDPALGLYDPALVLVELGLPVPVTVRGFADVDGAIKMSLDRRWSSRKGCDGEKCRRRLRGRGGTLQLILMPTSVTLDALTAARILDEQTGFAEFPISIADLNGPGNRVAWAERAWMDGPPVEAVFGRATASIVTLELDGADMVLGSIRRAGR